MTEPNDEAVDTAPDEGTQDVSALVADAVSAVLTDALAPLRDDVETIRRNKLDARNKKLNDESSAKDEEIEALKKQVLDLQPETAEAKDALVQRFRDDLSTQVKELATVKAQFQDAQRKLRRKELEDLVLADVATAHRDVALDLLEGTLRRQNINIDEVEDVGTIAGPLKQRIASALSVPEVQGGDPKPTTTTPGAPIDPDKIEWLTPDGRPAYSEYGLIPEEIRHLLPPEVFQKMIKPTQKDFGGLNL